MLQELAVVATEERGITVRLELGAVARKGHLEDVFVASVVLGGRVAEGEERDA